jgi:drug/metabolite transporter (DMT)-like permease
MFELILTNFRGEIAALVAAFLWAISSTIYAFLGARIPPLLLNLFKGLVAIILILLTFILTEQVNPNCNLLTAILLGVSGIIGIGIGDTAFFKALNSLGARKTLLLETLAPPLSAILAFLFLQEKLTSLGCTGIFITIIGVAWVISERTKEVVITQKIGIQGLKWALIATVSQASAAVISRFALSTTDISPLWSTLFRLLGGTIIVIILLLNRRGNQLKIIKSIWSIKMLLIITFTSFGSTYLGIWLQQTSLKFATTGIAQTLLATSPLFVIPMAVILGEKITPRAVLGALVALGGIGFLFISK